MTIKRCNVIGVATAGAAGGAVGGGGDGSGDGGTLAVLASMRVTTVHVIQPTSVCVRSLAEFQ